MTRNCLKLFEPPNIQVIIERRRSILYSPFCNNEKDSPAGPTNVTHFQRYRHFGMENHCRIDSALNLEYIRRLTDSGRPRLLGFLFGYSFFQCCCVHITGIMQWTFAGYGIKSTRVGIAYVLDFPGQGGNSLIKRQSYDPGKNIPCGPAWGTPFDLNRGYPAIFHFHIVFRQTKLYAVSARSLQAP